MLLELRRKMPLNKSNALVQAVLTGSAVRRRNSFRDSRQRNEPIRQDLGPLATQNAQHVVDTILIEVSRWNCGILNL